MTHQRYHANDTMQQQGLLRYMNAAASASVKSVTRECSVPTLEKMLFSSLSAESADSI